jgi:hypothetical protein
MGPCKPRPPPCDGSKHRQESTAEVWEVGTSYIRADQELHVMAWTQCGRFWSGTPEEFHAMIHDLRGIRPLVGQPRSGTK